MSQITIPPHERGALHVFAISRPMPAVKAAMSDPQTLAEDLLGQPLPERAAEVIAIADLAGLGLHSYLAEGHDIPAAQVDPDKAKLNALDGYALILFSSAFGDTGATLTPHQDLTLVGRYTQPHLQTKGPPIATDAAQPYSGVPSQMPATPPKGAARGSTVVLAIIALIALLIWWSVT